MKLAEELGSVEAADALLHSAGLDDLLDEQHWQAMLSATGLRRRRTGTAGSSAWNGSSLSRTLRRSLPLWHPDQKQKFFRKS